MEKFQVQPIDAEYYKRNIPCQNACPAHTDARGYVQAIAQGDYEVGYNIARQPNPLASSCGRVCVAPCETACRRGKLDAPIPIRALKRFLTQRYGVEGRYSFPLQAKAGEDNAWTWESYAALLRARNERHSRVAIIGSGPAGLTAAHDLALLGYEVTIFEALGRPGGMMRTGIPAYRLPRDILDKEINEIQGAGVEIRPWSLVNSLDSLFQQGYSAIFLALGAHQGARMGIEGEELAREAVTFLREVNLGQPVSVGDRVAVVGGGNAAIDAARTALRLGAKEVTILYRRTRREMPAIPEEIAQAEEEGIKLEFLIAPTRLARRQEGVKLFCVRMRLGDFDASGRRRPEPMPETEAPWDFDTVILAVGQVPDVPPTMGLTLSRGNTLEVNTDAVTTSLPGVFAGGDCVSGPASVIEASAAGHRAAKAIDGYLRGEPTSSQIRAWLTTVDPDQFFNTEYLKIKRQDPRLHLFPLRGEVEEGYTEEMAIAQARRCLNCHIQTVFDGEKCVLCGGCVDVCPQHCLKLVPLGDIEVTPRVRELITATYGLDNPQSLTGAAAMLKDEARCTRCGLCAKRCPTQAVTLMAFHFEETWAGEAGG